MNKKTTALLGMSATALILAACGNSGSGEREESDPIVISGKAFTEQYILPHILQQYIEDKTDYEVELNEGLGETSILNPALENGEIDMYVEYTGTGLEFVLDERVEENESSESVLDRVRAGYEEEFGITWLEPLGFENTYTLAYAEDADFTAETYSDLAAISGDLSIGAPHSFYERQGDGYDALAEAYGFEFNDKIGFDANIMYNAVSEGEVDVITAFTTDGRIERFNLQTTQDDMGFFPKYDAAVVVREDILEAYPELEATVNELAGQISEEEMQAMNARVDIDGDDYAAVATDFLEEKGLIGQ